LPFVIDLWNVEELNINIIDCYLKKYYTPIPHYYQDLVNIWSNIPMNNWNLNNFQIYDCLICLESVHFNNNAVFCSCCKRIYHIDCCKNLINCPNCSFEINYKNLIAEFY
jgi:hypothetical protein